MSADLRHKQDTRDASFAQQHWGKFRRLIAPGPGRRGYHRVHHRTLFYGRTAVIVALPLQFKDSFTQQQQHHQTTNCCGRSFVEGKKYEREGVSSSATAVPYHQIIRHRRTIITTYYSCYTRLHGKHDEEGQHRGSFAQRVLAARTRPGLPQEQLRWNGRKCLQRLRCVREETHTTTTTKRASLGSLTQLTHFTHRNRFWRFKGYL